MRTLSEPPLPTVPQLLAAIGSKEADAKPWTVAHPSYSATWFSSASEALAAAAYAVRSSGHALPAIWLPAYFCNYALRYVRSMDVALRFYDVEPDLTVDWVKLERRIQNDRGILVLVHYFGFPGQTSDAVKFCASHGLALIEDAAHVLIDAPGIAKGNAVVFSPHKLLPAPAGGLLMTRPELLPHVPKTAIAEDSYANLAWTSRRLAQRALTLAHFPWHRLAGYNKPDTSSSKPPVARQLTSCGSYARKILAVMQENVDSVVTARRSNYLRLAAATAHTSLAPMFLSLSDGVCPYVLPVKTDDAASVAGFFRSHAVPASPWPDLPPEVTSDARQFPNSTELGRHTLLLPVHQTLTNDQVEHVARLFRQRNAGR